MTYIKEGYKGYTICQSDDRGGKAGRGRNLTTSLQVRNVDGCVVRYVRFKVGDPIDQHNALVKARACIDKLVNHVQTKTRPG